MVSIAMSKIFNKATPSKKNIRNSVSGDNGYFKCVGEKQIEKRQKQPKS